MRGRSTKNMVENLRGQEERLELYKKLQNLRYEPGYKSPSTGEIIDAPTEDPKYVLILQEQRINYSIFLKVKN